MTDPNDLPDDGKKPRGETHEAAAAEVTRLRSRAQHAAHEVADTVQAADGNALRDHTRHPTRASKTRLSTAREIEHDADHDVRVRLAQGAEPIYGELEDIDDARSVAGEALDAGLAAWSQASDAVREVSRDAVSAARETFDDIGDQCRHYVREKPLRALAIAGAAGFVLALLLKRRR